VFERLVCQQNLDEFLGPLLLGRYKMRNGYANSVTRFIPRALRSYAVTQLRILYPTVIAWSRHFQMSVAARGKVNRATRQG